MSNKLLTGEKCNQGGQETKLLQGQKEEEAPRDQSERMQMTLFSFRVKKGVVEEELTNRPSSSKLARSTNQMDLQQRS